MLMNMTINTRLCARLQAQGLVHGMLRTDNVALLGSAIDVGGLTQQQEGKTAKNVVNMPAMYRLEKQPDAVLQCLGCLAVALSPFVDQSDLECELSHFWNVYSHTLASLTTD